MTSDELRAWRKRKGYSQRELAEILGVDTMTVSRWERGVREKIPPYLHLTLECIEKKGGKSFKGMKTEKERRKR